MIARFSFALFVALAFQPLTLFAHEHHTDNVCSAQVAGLCAHAGFAKDFAVGQTNEFMFHFMVKAPVDVAQLSEVHISMTLPAAANDILEVPATVQQLDANHFMVSNVIFPKGGNWEIHATALYQSLPVTIVLPIQVQE